MPFNLQRGAFFLPAADSLRAFGQEKASPFHLFMLTVD